jgi:hypothetical protein
LEPGGSAEEAADAHERIVGFLATAPGPIRPWARSQASLVDDAFARVTDPAGATRPALRPTVPAAPMLPEPAIAPMVPSPVVPSTAMPSGTTPSAIPADGAKRRSRPWRLLAAAGAIAALGVTAVAVAQLGNETQEPERTTIAQLIERFDNGPRDALALMDIGNAYYAARDYTVAAAWYAKVVEDDPANADALMALGAARFGGGDLDAARDHWTAALALQPENVELHFNLGVVALNRVPPDVAGVEAAWGEVLRLAPDSGFAESVRTRLAELRAAADAAASAMPESAASPQP